MINSRRDLKEYILADRSYYGSYTLKHRVRFMLTNDHLYAIRKYMTLLRKEEYYHNKKGVINRLIELVIARRKNNLGNRLGYYIRPNSLGKGVTLFHHGTIIIHGNARLGQNCKLHGDNCIGNNGLTNETPIIGNNVDIGFGAKVIGGVTIADNIKIGAGAVVVKSCLNSDATLVGIPAKEI